MVPGLWALGAKMSLLGGLSVGCMEPTYQYHVGSLRTFSWLYGINISIYFLWVP